MALSTLDHASSALIVQLARSEPGLGLARQLYDPAVLFRSASQMEAMATAFVSEGARLGLDPKEWRICASLRSIEGRENSFKTPLTQMSGVEHTLKAMAILAKGGASPWTLDAFPSRADPLALTTNSLGLAAPIWMVAFGTSDRLPIGARKVLIRAAVEHLALEDSPLFFDRLEQRLAQSRERANPQARAVMGEGDKAAKGLAQVILDCSDVLRARALISEGKFTPEIRASERVESILACCQALLAIKNAKALDANPEKIKKSLSQDQRDGLAKLRQVCGSPLSDEARVAKVFKEQAWLKDLPLAACLRVGREKSPMELALGRRNSAALRALREVGANVWLASAQAGQPKTALWAMRLGLESSPGKLNPKGWTDECAQEVAQLLIQGAWLNGGEDPKAACREQALECAGFKGFQADLRWAEQAERLAGLCERADLEAAIAGVERGPEASGALNEAQAEPVKKKSKAL